MVAKFKDEVVVYCGPMYSGKSFSLLFYIEKLIHAKIPYRVFKPEIDRYEGIIGSRGTQLRINAISIPKDEPEKIFNYLDLKKIKKPYVVVIDEIQFFSRGLIDVVKKLNRNRIQVVMAGLDQDAWGEPFGCVPDLLALATRVIKTIASCTKCAHSEATKTMSSKPKVTGFNIDVIHEEQYKPVCSTCFYKFNNPPSKK